MKTLLLAAALSVALVGCHKRLTGDCTITALGMIACAKSKSANNCINVLPDGRVIQNAPCAAPGHMTINEAQRKYYEQKSGY